MGVADQLTLEEAYAKWGAELVGYATALSGPTDAADVVADTFAELLGRDTASWDRTGDHKAFLFRCILNRARMNGRSAGRRTAREHNAAFAVQDRLPASGELRMSDPRVIETVRSLSPLQRAVIYLTYWEDLDPERVAQVLDTSVGTVKKHLARARARLRKALK